MITTECLDHTVHKTVYTDKILPILGLQYRKNTSVQSKAKQQAERRVFRTTTVDHTVHKSRPQVHKTVPFPRFQ